MKKASLLILTTIAVVLFSIGDSYGQCNNPSLNLLQDLLPNNASVCLGSSVTLGVTSCVANPDYRYLWTSSTESGTANTSSPQYSATGSTLNPGIVTFGLRVVTIEGTDTTIIGTDSLDVTVLNQADVDIVLLNSPPPCVGNDIQLQLQYSGGSGTVNPNEITWTGAVAQANPVNATDDNVQAGASYGVEVEDTEGCTASITDVSFTINPIPTGFSISGETDYCVGDQMQLNVVGVNVSNFDCDWTRGTEILTSNANCGYTGNALAGQYQLVLTSAAGCVSAPVIQAVTVNNLVLTIDPEFDEVCQNGPAVELNITSSQNTSNTDLIISDPNNGVIVGEQFIPTNNTPPDEYLVTYSASYEACEKEVEAIITILPLPVATITGAALGYCQGESMTLGIDAGPGNFTCEWNRTGAENCEITRDPILVEDAGTYSVLVTNDDTQCTANNNVSVSIEVDSLTVLVQPFTPPAGVCSDEGPVDLNLFPPLGQFQNTLSTSPNVNSALNGELFLTQIPPASSVPVTYTFTYNVTDGFCTKEASADVIVLPVPEVTVSSITPVCNINSVLDLTEFVSPPGGIFTLSDDTEFDGVFNPVDTTANISLSFNYEFIEPTTGCSTIKENNTVQINPELVIDFEDDLALCFGTEDNLGAQASGGGQIYTYAWSNDNLLENPNVATPTLITTIESGDYTFELTVTDQNNCVRTGTQNLIIRNQPEVFISSNPVIFCAGDQLVLTANVDGGIGEPNYFWQNDNTTPDQPSTFQTDSIFEEESFSVLIGFPAETGCALASTNKVFVPSPTPNPSILTATTSSDALICDKQVSIYFAENRVPGTELVWSLGGLNQNVDSVVSDDDLFYVYWADNLVGTESIFLDEFLSEDCQALEELEVTFSQGSAPPPAEIFLSELNGILVYNQSGLCYRWGYIDPNANLNANPPESYLNFDLDENTFQSFIIGELDTTLTYFCQTWLPGDCEDADGSCSSTIVYQPKNNSITQPPPKEKVGFEVFPNPNTGNFNFRIGDLMANRNYKWELRNPLGQIIDSRDFVPSGVDHTESISIGNQAQGIYLLTISDGREILRVSRVNIQN